MTEPPSSAGERLDRRVHAALAQATAWLSPPSAALALFDWAAHLAASPGRQSDLAIAAMRQVERFWRWQFERTPAAAAALATDAPPQDRRFAAPEWQQWPFAPMQQAFLLAEAWWDEAARGVRGVSKHHEDLVAFGARQWLDAFSPGNFLATNPVALRRTLDEGGANLVRGLWNGLDDAARAATGAGPRGSEAFVVGRDVGATPGKVVMKNRLVELIQYAPTTAKVRPEPVLIVPAWIMKYYILDLSPQNSLIKYLVDQGHTVFCLSWKNPDADDRDLGMDDYLELGLAASLDTVGAIVPRAKIHAAGYCLGGTLLAIGAAAMARDGDDRLASLTLFAAQTDFSEPGELGLFIDEGQIAVLEDQMAETGYLTAQQMAGAFQMLRSYDLLWSKMVGEYLLGERDSLNDLMAWNADATRMPAKMHAQYLRRLFLDNDLAEGRYPVGGRAVALSDLHAPVFCVGTETDHVAPWRSVYKLHHETVAAITFVLTSGGHNAGIASEPGHPHRSYRILERPGDGAYLAPDAWLDAAAQKQGSWWPEWTAWLDARSGAPIAPPRLGRRGARALADAPGDYVLVR
ncbi:MAG TPA: alpha/beta fold hydrolase [Dokdonella sp.]